MVGGDPQGGLRRGDRCLQHPRGRAAVEAEAWRHQRPQLMQEQQEQREQLRELEERQQKTEREMVRLRRQVQQLCERT